MILNSLFLPILFVTFPQPNTHMYYDVNTLHIFYNIYYFLIFLKGKQTDISFNHIHIYRQTYTQIHIESDKNTYGHTYSQNYKYIVNHLSRLSLPVPFLQLHTKTYETDLQELPHSTCSDSGTMLKQIKIVKNRELPTAIC